MQNDEGEKKSAEQLKRERADCKRCEKWRDELARDSALRSPRSFGDSVRKFP